MEFSRYENGAGASAVISTNETNHRNALSLICSSFSILCDNRELQGKVREFQSLLSTNYIKKGPIDYTPKSFNDSIHKLGINIGSLIKRLLPQSTNILSPEIIGEGVSGKIVKNQSNHKKVIKIIKVRDTMVNFDLFNEYIIQRLLHHKVVELNSSTNIPLKMHIPNVYSFTKKGGINTFIKMNYISNYISLFDYITRYSGDERILIENLNNLLTNYIIYLRILQDTYSFIHYDMNLNNLLLDVDSENNIIQFHLIDFGQSYINFNDYHFLGTINHAFVTSLHANNITNKTNGFWKSIDIIYLLFMIIYRFVEKHNYKKINESGKSVIDIHKIESDNILFYQFILKHFIDINMFEKIFNIIYIDGNYFKYLILNYNHGIDIFLRVYSSEDREEKMNYIFSLFDKYANI